LERAWDEESLGLRIQEEGREFREKTQEEKKFYDFCRSVLKSSLFAALKKSHQGARHPITTTSLNCGVLGKEQLEAGKAETSNSWKSRWHQRKG